MVVASHWMTVMPFKKNEVDYHQTCEVDSSRRWESLTECLKPIAHLPNWTRCIVEKVLNRSWEKMTPQQREDFLNKIDHTGSFFK